MPADESTCASFAADYFAARERFLELARSCNAKIATHPLNAAGPAGDPLSIDTAYVGVPKPKRLLVIVSGTHGVEGFAGAALQQKWLEELSRSQIPDNAGCLLIHALNPFGFAWLRRANEHNVDLNRNALSQFPGPPNPSYRRLNAWLNPPSTSAALDLFLLEGAWLSLRHGRAAMQAAIVQGQYEFPRGLFYGGDRLQASTRILFEILGDGAWRDVECCIFIDVHTGVGEFGTYKLMVDFEDTSDACRRMQTWFDADTVISNRPADSLAHRVSGGLTARVAALLVPRNVYACVLEFGTLPPARTLASLRRENRAYHGGAASSEVQQHAGASLRDVFCPPEIGWRRQVLRQGMRVFAQAARACFTSSLTAGVP
jgi:uncharacterized protein DUF2817